MTREKLARTAAQTAVLMAILTLVSKLLGFVREMVLAGFFGTGYIVDAYVMAQAIPGIIFTGIFASIATAYMPLFSEKVEIDGQTEGNVFTSQVMKILLVVSAVSSIIGLCFSDQFVAVFASGFEGQTAALTSFFLKVTFSYVVFSSLSSLLDSFLQYKSTFLPQIIVGYTQNIIVIAVIVVSAMTNYYFLAFGYLIAYVVRYFLFYLLARKRGYKYEPSNKGATKNTLKKIAVLAIPVFIGSTISQINVFVDKTLASGLPEGSVSALNYANILNTMILTLTVTIFTTIIYPRLAKANSLGDKERFNEMASTGLTLIFMLALPCALGAILYSGEIVQVVYERGAFDIAATSMTGIAYLFYSAGLLFLALNELLLRIYYSMHDMKTPMIFAGVSVIINIVFNLILVRSMAHGGLALATSIAAAVNTGLLYMGLRKKHPHIRLISSGRKLIKIGIAAVLSVGISYIFHLALTNVIWLPRLVYLGVTVIIAALIYIIILVVLRTEELKIIEGVFKRKYSEKR